MYCGGLEMEMVVDMPCEVSFALGNKDVTTILVDNALTSQSPNVPKGPNIVAKSCNLEVEELEFATLGVEKKSWIRRLRLCAQKNQWLKQWWKKNL